MIYKVSILVPIYGVENYIEKCVRSLFEQTFDSIEYVFVDDKSKDNSITVLENIIDDYPNRKDAIKIIHHTENRGLAMSRNTAILNATSEYILHVDSDDYIELDAVELLYNKAVETNSDMVCADFCFEGVNWKKIEYCNIKSAPHDFFELILKNKTYHSVCNKLLKRSIYVNNNLIIPSGLNYGEDYFIITRYSLLMDRVSKVDKPLYHYIQYNINSYTKKTTEMHFINTVKSCNSLDEFVKEHGLFEKFEKLLIESKLRGKASLFISGERCLRDKYKDMFIDDQNRILNIDLTFLQKIVLILNKSNYKLILDIVVFFVQNYIVFKRLCLNKIKIK